MMIMTVLTTKERTCKTPSTTTITENFNFFFFHIGKRKQKIRRKSTWLKSKFISMFSTFLFEYSFFSFRKKIIKWKFVAYKCTSVIFVTFYWTCLVDIDLFVCLRKELLNDILLKCCVELVCMPFDVMFDNPCLGHQGNNLKTKFYFLSLKFWSTIFLIWFLL